MSTSDTSAEVVCALPQYIFGFYAFAFPKLSQKNRSAAAPIHAFLGKTVLIFGLATMTVRSCWNPPPPPPPGWGSSPCFAEHSVMRHNATNGGDVSAAIIVSYMQHVPKLEAEFRARGHMRSCCGATRNFQMQHDSRACVACFVISGCLPNPENWPALPLWPCHWSCRQSGRGPTPAADAKILTESLTSWGVGVPTSIQHKTTLVPAADARSLTKDLTSGGLGVQTGIQEKTTLVQTLMKPPGGMYTAYFILPAILELLLMLIGAAVLFHHTEPGKGKSDQPAQQSFLEEGGASSHEAS